LGSRGESMSVCLRVSVPVCTLRKPYAREFLETERVPPPATVYGFLLSLVGEEDRRAYVGTRIAVAVTHQPQLSQVVRSAWRVDDKGKPPGVRPNKKPDYQELLTELEIGVWIQDGPLAGRARGALRSPRQTDRFGGLSLGESRDLVDEVVLDPAWSTPVGTWLVGDPDGDHPLPVWVDHVSSVGTRWKQFRLVSGRLEAPAEDDPRWIEIAPSQAEDARVVKKAGSSSLATETDAGRKARHGEGRVQDRSER